MKLISWKKVESWKCLSCGLCCKCFDIPLETNEYTKIFKIFGTKVFDFNKNPIKFFLTRRKNGRCIFQYNLNGKSICKIHQIKPIICKRFPFLILKSNNKKSLYKYKEKHYNLYLERNCKGINLGKPTNEFIYQTIPKIIKESLNLTKTQNIIISKLF